MCPDPQLLSIYMDGELPSPWKEKMETHLALCSVCKEKLKGFKRFFENEKEQAGTEQKLTTEARDRVWQKLQLRKPIRRLRPYTGLWQARLSIPLPAAAVIILAVLVVLLIRAGFQNNDGFINSIAESGDRANIILAAEEAMPVFPAADLNSVFQHLVSDSTDIIILRLPESRNFLRAGDPAIIRAADYSRRFP